MYLLSSDMKRQLSSGNTTLRRERLHTLTVYLALKLRNRNEVEGKSLNPTISKQKKDKMPNNKLPRLNPGIALIAAMLCVIPLAAILARYTNIEMTAGGPHGVKLDIYNAPSNKQHQSLPIE